MKSRGTNTKTMHSIKIHESEKPQKSGMQIHEGKLATVRQRRVTAGGVQHRYTEDTNMLMLL